MKKTLNSLLIKPSGPDCNLDCAYCFYLDKAEMFSKTKTHRMSLSILENMVKQALQQSGPHMSFGWQGGEPTVMGLSFFRKSVEFQEKYGSGRSVGNGLQTNGILINHDWSKFLAQYNFLVGLSLDGPEHVHDHYRFNKQGKGTWKKVHDKAKMLLDAGVATNALIVVNDYSVNYPEEIYEFHKALGLTFMQFIPCVEPDPENSSKAAPFSVSAKKYGEFLNRLFDLWHADIVDGIAGTSVRHFDSVFHKYVGLDAPECTMMKTCGEYVVVEHNGDVYSCDFFVENRWKLGNIATHRLDEMLNAPRQEEFGNMKSLLPEECGSCEWLQKCQGGCTKDRISDPSDKGSNHFCQSYKMFFAHADAKLQTLAEQWNQNQVRPA